MKHSSLVITEHNISLGACNNEAYRLCPDFETAKDIIACLKDHEGEISQACRENLYSRDHELDTRAKQMRLNQLRVTEFITVISIAYLLAQLLLAGWALKKFRELYKLYSNVDTSVAQGTAATPMSPVEPMEVSFLGISYWIRQNRSWTKPLDEAPCVRVLHRVSFIVLMISYIV
jgi:hypothetical protein